MILLVFVAGCGDPNLPSGAKLWTPPATQDAGDARWTQEIVVDRDSGALSAPGFNALIDASAPGWARSPSTAAVELLDLDRPFDGPVKIYLSEQTERDDPVVTATLTGLGDDSVEAKRYRVEFARGDDGRYRFVSGEWSQRCQSGRGHRSFNARTCS